MLQIHRTEGAARRSTFTTSHGKIELPAFMNIATAGAVKGGLSALDITELGAQVQLCNTYHLHLRPGDETVRELGGLHRFTRFAGPILTDSGGFQVFSLAKLRSIREEGVTFASHIDGRRLFMGPEESMRIQANLGADIAMAFDECVKNPAEYEYAKESCARTARWLKRCISEHNRLNQSESTINQDQMLFGINQGATFDDLRINHMNRIAEFDLDGYAIGGLAVGEPAEVMYHVVGTVAPHMPADRPRYLMGVGTPADILEAVARGVDLFDCVLPSRNGRHGHIFTSQGVLNMLNRRYQRDDTPLDAACHCPTCMNFSRAYVHHLHKAGEILALRLCVQHNLYFYNNLMAEIRAALESGTFGAFRRQAAEALSRRIYSEQT